VSKFVLLAGDTHGTINCGKVRKDMIAEYCSSNNLCVKDIEALIILGDFGMVWAGHEDDQFESLSKFYKRSYPVYAVYGNHENYDAIKLYPLVERYGAQCRQITDNVHFIERGETITIGSKRFLVLGGAKSIDKCYRREFISWWKQEYWSKSEIDLLMQKLETDNVFDYVLSHTGTTEAKFDLIGINEKYRDYELFKDDIETLNAEIEKLITFNHWYYAHYHEDKSNEKFSCLFNNLKHVMVD